MARTPNVVPTHAPTTAMPAAHSATVLRVTTGAGGGSAGGSATAGAVTVERAVRAMNPRRAGAVTMRGFTFTSSPVERRVGHQRAGQARREADARGWVE